MATNLTIESPNVEKISKEAGQYTSDAIGTLWLALNETRAELRRGLRQSQEIVAPKVLQVSAAASVDNLDLQGSSVIEFIGASAQNLTGFRAPETGASRLVFVVVSGTGTITAKHNVTSETLNRLVNGSGADVTLATNAGIVYVYLSGRWREVA